MVESTWFVHGTATAFFFCIIFSPYPTIDIVLISF